MSAYFVERDGRFEATEHTRGPWNEAHQHGGPPAALMVRAFERLAGGARLARLDFELPRPVPIAELSLSAQVVKAGRKVTRLAAELSAGDQVVMRASALAVKLPSLPGIPPLESPPLRPPEDSTPWSFPFFRSTVGYHTSMDMRVAAGRYAEGKMAVWMRMVVALVDGEAATPLQRLVAAADSGSGVSLLLDVNRYTFLNPDLTLHVLRAPEGEWMCLDAETRADASGIGLAETRLHDLRGFVGRGVQTLVVEAR